MVIAFTIQFMSQCHTPCSILFLWFFSLLSIFEERSGNTRFEHVRASFEQKRDRFESCCLGGHSLSLGLSSRHSSIVNLGTCKSCSSCSESYSNRADRNTASWFWTVAVDASKIRLSPADMDKYPHYLQSFSSIPGGWEWDVVVWDFFRQHYDSVGS